MKIKPKTYLEIEQEHYRLMKVNRNKSDKERYDLILKSENSLYFSKDILTKYFIDNKKKNWTWEEIVMLLEKKNV